MKFSLSSSFARLTLFVLLAVFLVTIGGRLVALSGASAKHRCSITLPTPNPVQGSDSRPTNSVLSMLTSKD